MTWAPLAIVAVPFVTVWLCQAIWRPMAPCRWCGGRRRVGDSERWRNRDCKRCGNTGQRMTLGARIVRGPGRWDR